MILYSSIAGKLLNIPVIGTVHDKYYFMEKEYRRLAYKLTQMLGCTIVTVSEDIKNNLSLRWRIKGDDIITIYNGTDLSVFDRRFDENGKRKRLGLGKDDIVVISVGRLVKIKGHASMLKAVKNIIEQNEKVKFLIVGDGPERATIEEIVKSEGIDRHIILTGHREDINELLKVSDIFVQTSLSEGLSCTIMEAIASGLPVVGTDVGGNKELLTHGREGYLVPVGDRRAFEEKVIALANDRNLRARLARNARQKAERKFPLETMVGKYENLYQGLLS
jgi:glycosyltransferase involved in cell wall biosynthesis